MKRPDEFEAFHQRRKRRPLTDISDLHNITQNTSKAHDSKRRNVVKIFNIRHLERNRNPPKQKKYSNLIQNICKTFEEHQHETSEISQYKHLSSSLKSDHPVINLRTKSDKSNFLALDYNRVVASNNRILQRFDRKYGYDHLSSTGQTTEPADGHGSIVGSNDKATISAQTVTVVNAIGEFLLAVSVEHSTEVFLLINRSNIQPQKGNSIILGRKKDYMINGTNTKVYCTWEVLQ